MEFYGFECETHENSSIRNDQMLMKCEKVFAITEWRRVISRMSCAALYSDEPKSVCAIMV